MEKSIYSLMLFDEIIEEVDQLAYINKTNRSQLINDILADYFGLQTPEQKIRIVLKNLEEEFSDSLSISQLVNHSSIQFGKSLKYKYRPQIRYSYEFTGSGDGRYAVLKVSSRTKNQELSRYLNHFFNRVAQMEWEKEMTDGCCEHDALNRKFVREFKESTNVTQDAESITDHLIRYLSMLDTALNRYFADPGNSEALDDVLNELYEKYEVTN